MKIYWGYVAAAAALGAFWAAYDQMPSSRDNRLAKVEKKCVAMLVREAGARIEPSKQACSCLAGKASQWRDANPKAEYTRQVHMGFAVSCFNQVDMGAMRSGVGIVGPEGFGNGGFGADPESDPARTEVNRQPHLPHQKPKPSDWGGDGFASDGAWDEE